MMTAGQLYDMIREKKSFLCVGLDSDIEKIPAHLRDLPDPVFQFNRQIVDATHDITLAYKPNLAFYESRGHRGWEELEGTVAYIRTNYPGIFLIADAKRGDIGNTSRMYASAFFERMDFDAVTVAPYMGEDSVRPFLEFEGKWVIVLGLTSNPGANDFQMLPLGNNADPLYMKVIEKAASWGNPDNMMFVAGATRAEMLKDIRKAIPGHFLLVPGIGAQGGSLEEVVSGGMNDVCGLIINASRSIIFADHSVNFAAAARTSALELQLAMAAHLS